MSEFRKLYLPCKNREEADKIAKALVEEKLVACANISLNDIHSVYTWKGEVQEADEVLLLASTHKSLVEKIIARVKELHSYDTPAIYFLEIEEVSPGTEQWLKEVLAL